MKYVFSTLKKIIRIVSFGIILIECGGAKMAHRQLALEAGDMEQVLVAGATVRAECQGGGE